MGDPGMGTHQEAESTDRTGARFHHLFALHSVSFHKTVPYLGAL